MVLTAALTCPACGTRNAIDAPFCSACYHPLTQAPVPEQLRPFTLFRNRYAVLEKVGEGGFGSVYKARDMQSNDRLVAIKEVCLTGLSSQAVSDAADAFQREVRLLSQLDHPNLPRLYEYVQMPDYWYLVMDFIEGETLEQYQHRMPGGRLLLSEVLSIGIQLCAVLDYLHTWQPPIVFRDLKPSNVMRTPTGRLYLIDFGIARYFKPGQTKDTVALGSHGYAAPEQYGRAQTTPRTDIYSLGVVLHQLLTTKDPSEAPFCFSPLRPRSPEERVEPGSLTTSMVEVLVNKLETLVNRMLAMEMEKRPSSIAQVKEELEVLSKLWTDIYKGYWRPKLGYSR